ncbi:hypothetical protein SprV_0902774900 [Sparganum proliferum]
MFSTRSSQKSRNLALNDGARSSKRRTLKRRNAIYLDFNDDSTISSSLVQKFKTSSNAENYRQGGDKSKHLEVLRKSLQSLANEIHNDSKELTSLIKESLNRADSDIDIASKESPALPAPGELKELKDTIRQLTKGVSSENKQIKSLLQDSLSSHNKSSSGNSKLMVAHSDEKPTLGFAEDPENSLVRRALDEVKDNVNNLGRVFRDLLGRRTADAANCSVPASGPKNTPITDQLRLRGWDTQRSPALSGIQLSSGGQSQTISKTDELDAPKASSSATDSILLEALAVMKESIMAMSKVSTSEVAANRIPNNNTEVSNALSEIRKCLQTIEELKSRRSEKPINLDASVAATTSARPKAIPVKFTAHSHDKRKRTQHRKKASHHKRHRKSSSEESDEDSDEDEGTDDDEDESDGDDDEEENGADSEDEEDDDDEEEVEEEEEEMEPLPPRRHSKTPKITNHRSKIKVEEKKNRGSKYHHADGDVQKTVEDRRVRRRLQLKIPPPRVADKACQRSSCQQAAGYFTAPTAPLGMSYWMPQPQALYPPFTPRWYAPTAAVQPSTAPSGINNSMSRSASYDE